MRLKGRCLIIALGALKNIMLGLWIELNDFLSRA